MQKLVKFLRCSPLLDIEVFLLELFGPERYSHIREILEKAIYSI